MNKLFVAKFARTSGAPFIEDKNGNFPMIGEVLAGTAKGSIINGTIFEREGYETGVLYLCNNSVDEEYPDNVQTNIISKVTVLEFMQLSKDLGVGRVILTSSDEDTEEETAPATAPAKAGKKAEKPLV